jgi:hypothetical protein
LRGKPQDDVLDDGCKRMRLATSLPKMRWHPLHRSILLFLCAFALGDPREGLGAEDLQGVWQGEMSCAKLSFTKAPQKVPFEMAVSGSHASFARKVWNQDNSAIVGSEEGRGEIGTNGSVKLFSEWKSAGTPGRYSYHASYAGTLVNNVGSLAGRQVWTANGVTEERACSISLKKLPDKGNSPQKGG